jgi:hypothetical protein
LLEKEIEQYESSIAPLVKFPTEKKSRIANAYMKEESKFLISSLEKDFSNFSRVCQNKKILLDDFKNIETRLIYDNITKGANRKSDDDLSMEMKWSPVFDKRSTPYEMKIDPMYEPAQSQRKYGCISVNGSPVFYLILFSVQELINAVR